MIDLEGRAALPGINDAHVHGLAAGLSLPPLSLDVSFPAVDSIAAVAAAVRAAVADVPAGTWIRGSGWNLALLNETRADPNRLPTRQDLDAVSPDHPVVLRDFSFHTVWVNTKALQLAGIDRNTPTPSGGVIDRDAAGDPIGLLRESAQRLILEKLPPLSDAQLRSALRTAVGVLHSLGITSYTDPGLTPAEIGIYRDALANRVLRARVTLMLTSSDSLLLGGTGGGSVRALAGFLERYPRPRVFDERLLALRAVKIFADGIPPNETAWVHDAYEGGGHGELVIAGDTEAERAAELARIIRRAHSAGYQVGTHATGDRTLDVVVAAYVRALRQDRRNRDPRHYTIHSDLISDRALQRLARNGLGVNMNPAIKALIADSMIPVLGRERASRQWPMRSALRAGTALTSASDWPVTPPDWRSGVAAAVLRKDTVSGNVSGPGERLGVRQALRSYTVAGAWQDHALAWKGPLTRGRVADICVLDGKLPTARSEVSSLAETAIAMTVFGGDVVYENDGRRSARGERAGVPVPTRQSRSHRRALCRRRGLVRPRPRLLLHARPGAARGPGLRRVARHAPGVERSHVRAVPYRGWP